MSNVDRVNDLTNHIAKARYEITRIFQLTNLYKLESQFKDQINDLHSFFTNNLDIMNDLVESENQALITDQSYQGQISNSVNPANQSTNQLSNPPANHLSNSPANQSSQSIQPSRKRVSFDTDHTKIFDLIMKEQEDEEDLIRASIEEKRRLSQPPKMEEPTFEDQPNESHASQSISHNENPSNDKSRVNQSSHIENPSGDKFHIENPSNDKFHIEEQKSPEEILKQIEESKKRLEEFRRAEEQKRLAERQREQEQKKSPLEDMNEEQADKIIRSIFLSASKLVMKQNPGKTEEELQDQIKERANQLLKAYIKK
jgi:hypothetical protein